MAYCRTLTMGLVLIACYASTADAARSQTFPGASNGCYKDICFDFPNKPDKGLTWLLEVQACNKGMENTSFDLVEDSNGTIVARQQVEPSGGDATIEDKNDHPNNIDRTKGPIPDSMVDPDRLSTLKKEFVLSKSIHYENRFGIKVKTTQIKGLPFVDPTDSVEFYTSVDSKLAVGFPAGTRCSILGYYPIDLTIILYPNGILTLGKWVNKNSQLFTDKRIRLPEETYSNNFNKHTKNVRVVSILEGNEEIALRSLAKEGIAIDAKFQPLPLGPESLIFDFAGPVTLFGGASQTLIIQRLHEIFRDAFPKLTDKDFSVSLERGSRYLVSIMAPVSRIDDLSDFSGRWLIAKIYMVFTRNLTSESNYADRLFVDIPDAFLPKWPGDSSAGLLVNNYRQFHLTPEGSGPTENFKILEDIQTKLKDIVISKYSGSVID